MDELGKNGVGEEGGFSCQHGWMEGENERTRFKDMISSIR